MKPAIERSARATAALEARRAGRALEKWAEQQHATAIARGCIAWMRHVSPRVEMQGGGRAIITGEACADFAGCAFEGSAIVVECKSTREERLHFSAVNRQQREQLDATAAAGGGAILLVEFRALPGAPKFAVPWRALNWTIQPQGRRPGSNGSLSPADLRLWAVVEPTYLAKFYDRAAV